jgi:hypothetical protein
VGVFLVVEVDLGVCVVDVEVVVLGVVGIMGKVVVGLVVVGVVVVLGVVGIMGSVVVGLVVVKVVVAGLVLAVVGETSTEVSKMNYFKCISLSLRCL